MIQDEFKFYKPCKLLHKGIKKVPQIIEFVGLVCLLSGIVRLVLRRDRVLNLQL